MARPGALILGISYFWLRRDLLGSMPKPLGGTKLAGLQSYMVVQKGDVYWAEFYE